MRFELTSRCEVIGCSKDSVDIFKKGCSTIVPDRLSFDTMGVLTYLLLFLWLGATLSTAVDLQKRIIGGRDCRPDERPYHVKFTYPDGKLICGGSLIGDSWILTAAHCRKTKMKVLLNPHPGPKRPVQIVKYAYYKDIGGIQDIMLLKLCHPTRHQAIPLPNCKTRLQIGNVVQIAGYGSKTKDPNNEREAAVLQCADFEIDSRSMFIKNNTRDYELYGHTFEIKTDSADTSVGDSGGGVVFNNQIYGVHLGLIRDSRGHAGATSFLDVCHYREWIRSVTNL